MASGQDIARIPANKHAYAAWSKLIDTSGPELAGTSRLIAEELKDTAVQRPSASATPTSKAWSTR
ncbi:hypothetical protein NKH77_16805 [Streptomyces sp. M19]